MKDSITSTSDAQPSVRLCERIRQARANAALTKAELARRVGVCLSAAVQWEHPQGTAPTVTNLTRIAQITDVAFEWLATGRGAIRIAIGDGPATIHPAAVAMTMFEERLLRIARELPSNHHEPLLAMLSTWTKNAR